MQQDAIGCLHVHTQDDTLHELSADDVCQLVQSFKRMMLLVAAAVKEKGDVKHLTATELASQFSMVCMPAEPGSFRLPFAIRFNENVLFEEAKPVLATIMLTLSSLATGALDENSPIKRLSDENKESFMECVSDLMPKKSGQWKTTIEAKDLDENIPRSIEVTEQLVKNAGSILRNSKVQEAIETVIVGRLVGVQFERNQFDFRSERTGLIIKCIVPAPIIPTVLMEREKLLSVYGRFELNEEGAAVKNRSVISVSPIDFTGINIKEIRRKNLRLITKDQEGKLFTPKLDDETKQQLLVQDDDLNIDAYAEDRDTLIGELKEQICFLWEEYAREDDNNLTDKAKLVKKNLLATFMEV